ncbi:MAG: O-antigen ligase family protein [Planctomycetes bacterium]|nr:O-antigen ligase family protein [Planctomycetota bacterium]
MLTSASAKTAPSAPTRLEALVRVYILYLVIAFLSLYAYRDWFKSLCGLILLMAVIEHPDMPKTIMGIQGLNPWNVLLVNVVLGWLMNRRREGLVWDMPRHISIAMGLYILVILVGFMRLMLADRVGMSATVAGLVSEELINTIKWLVPGILLFDGCRSRRRLMLGMVSILALYLLMSLQVVRYIPLDAVQSGAALTVKTRKLISANIGYHAVAVAMMLSGTAWAVLATLPLVRKRRYQILVVGIFVFMTYALALTAGRMGYVTWGVVGLILCLLRWRKRLLLLPLFAVLATFVTPGATERMLQGFGESSVSGETYTDDYAVTSGRTLIWPHVVDKIMQSPLLGYGREAMVHTGLARWLAESLNEDFHHPHNAYLEWTLDNGLLGLIIALVLYGIIVAHAVALFRDRSNPWHAAVGGIALALVLGLLVAGMGSQTLYPREDTLGMWAAIGLMISSVGMNITLSKMLKCRRESLKLT